LLNKSVKKILFIFIGLFYLSGSLINRPHGLGFPRRHSY
jgi:hypothetical protein